MDIEVIEASLDHAPYIGENMCELDKMEVYASHMLRPEPAIKSAIQSSEKAWTVLLNGNPEFSFGVSSMSRINQTGSPWMLGTGEVARISMRFLRESRMYVDEMLDVYPYLENHVASWNKKSINWLRFIGFDILEAAPYGPFRKMFHKFTLEKT